MSSPVAQDYIAGRAFQDSGQLSLALRSLAAAQGDTGDISLQAEIYSSLGDVYYQRQDVIQGRMQYLNSIYVMQNIIEFKNLRAQKDLTTNAFVQ
jgi:Flp pilus assembly protein CpaB